MFTAATLTEKSYSQAISELIKRDSDLQRAVSKWGNPPFWTHPPGFSGIVLAILSQQVSLESAQATFTKLDEAIGPINPRRFLSLGDNTLRGVGFSRQKASYIRGLAQRLIAGEFRLHDLESMNDEEARRILMEERGIGAWTADTYLLFALRRPDAWPTGDLALVKAIQELKRLNTAPSSAKADEIADRWRPWRGWPQGSCGTIISVNAAEYHEPSDGHTSTDLDR